LTGLPEGVSLFRGRAMGPLKERKSALLCLSTLSSSTSTPSTFSAVRRALRCLPGTWASPCTGLKERHGFSLATAPKNGTKSSSALKALCIVRHPSLTASDMLLVFTSLSLPIAYLSLRPLPPAPTAPAS